MERHTQQEQSGRDRLRQPESEQTTPPGETGPRHSDQDQSRHDSRWRRAATLRPILWRLHFIGGFLAGPVVISLALTGILFAWNPQIQSLLYRDALTARADRIAEPPRPLAEQVVTARRQRPNWHLAAVIPASAAAATTAVVLVPERGEFEFGPGEDAITIYVDPGSARVTGEIVEAERPAEWLRNLHSSWRLGPLARPLTELAASWALVAVLTGIYLWWPLRRRRRGPPVDRLVPQLRAGGRKRWRELHSMVGVWVSVALLVMVGTGLTWTIFAGSWVDRLRNALNAHAPVVQTTLTRVGDAAVAPARPSIDEVAAVARQAGLPDPVEIRPPVQPGTAWTVATVERQWPIRQATVAIHPVSGEIMDRVDWDEYPLLAKATTLGIQFHQAELFGLANQIFLTLLATALIVIVLAGYLMWWRRRPPHGVGIPPKLGTLRSVPIPLLVGFALLLVLLPTLGVSFVAFLVIEWIVQALRRPACART